MTIQETPVTLDQWLDIAAHGLPETVGARVRAEYKAHYEDAVEDYLMQDKDPSEAGQAALADLGDARDASRGLRETHLARRWYIAAAVVGLIFPVLLWAGFMCYETLSPAALARITGDLVILLPTFFVLYVLKNYMALRTGTRTFDAPVLGIIAALSISNAAVDLRLVFFPVPEDTFAWIMNAAPGDFLIMIGIAGSFMTALCLFWLAIRLLDLEDALHGLRIPIAVAAILTGLSVVGFAAGIAANNLIMASISDMAAMVTHLTIVALLALLFFRAAYRPSGRSVRVA